MTRLQFFLIVLLAAALPCAADSPVFVLRADASGQGIVRLDGATLTPFASFLYRSQYSLLAPKGRFELSAFSDRVVAQGSAFFEFDAASGQLLRRYPALGASFGLWTFHGQVITEETAARLGIAPGVYGEPFCPDSHGVITLCIGDVAFPGYPREPSNVLLPQVLMRRELDRPLLSLVKIFPSHDRRYTAIDPERRQFWFSLLGNNAGGTGTVERLTSAPIANGAIGEETTVRETIEGLPSSNQLYRAPTTFAFDAVGDAFLHAYLYDNLNETRLTRSTLRGEEQTLMRGAAWSLFISGITTLPADAPARYKQLVPAVANAPGANGTHWRSDVWLFNPSDGEITARLHRVSDPSFERLITIASKASAKLSNVLAELGRGASLDALIFDAPYRAGAQLSVYSRTYTPAPGGGTYGQAIPAVPLPAGYSNHLDGPSPLDVSEAEAALLILDKRDPARFRHNLGIVNMSDEPITMRFRYALVSAHPPSDPAREATVVAPPHGVRIVTIETLFPPEMIATLPPRIEIFGDRPAPIWLSMVDNVTGDASFVPFSIYGMEAPAGARLAIPAIAHAPGANGTRWQTDLYGFFPSTGEQGFQVQQPEAVFHPSSGGCEAKTMRLVSSPGADVTNPPSLPFWNTEFLDVARQLCAADDARGALELNTGSWMTAWARVYTTAQNGGTFGEMLPLYPSRGWPSRHFAGIELHSEVRVNVGLYNGFDTSSTVELRLYDAAGTLVTTRQVALAPRESMQQTLRQLFGDVADGLYSLSLVPLDAAGCWPYVSIVDNVTGDPTNWW